MINMSIKVNRDSIINIALASNGLLSTCEFKSCVPRYVQCVYGISFGNLSFVHKSHDCVLMHYIIMNLAQLLFCARREGNLGAPSASRGGHSPIGGL